MRLHGARVARLAEDLEQLVVAEEEEPREPQPLQLHVVVEAARHHRQQVARLYQAIE